MSYSDCFANQGTKCRVLTTMLCNSGKCSFYKTHKQFKADIEKYPPYNYKKEYENKHKNEVKSDEK